MVGDVRTDRFVEVGCTAMRDPKTGEFLPAVPLYIKRTPEAAEAEQMLIKDLAHLFALRMKTYVDGCQKDGRSAAM